MVSTRGPVILGRMKTLAHLSDLHIGLGPRVDAAAEKLVASLEHVDHVVVTGDVTHRGRRAELERFREIFAPLAGRLTLVPGNHDRLGEDAGAEIMGNERVHVASRPGLHLVLADSTGPHNRSRFMSHGRLSAEDLREIEAALDRRPAGALAVLLLHHHPLPLPDEDVYEKLVTWLGLPQASELAGGWDLIERVTGRCDLILHGHKHIPSSYRTAELGVYNAGSSTELGRARLFRHRGGVLQGRPQWCWPNSEVLVTRAAS
jgi:3',5'-cyclic AMP phosphodiesterase CpdA